MENNEVQNLKDNKTVKVFGIVKLYLISISMIFLSYYFTRMVEVILAICILYLILMTTIILYAQLSKGYNDLVFRRLILPVTFVAFSISLALFAVSFLAFIVFNVFNFLSFI